MSFDQDQQRVFGPTGREVSRILFGTAALGNSCRVISEQAKVEIVSEWFRQMPPPILVEAAYEHGNGMALEVLGRALRRLDISGDEIVIHLVATGSVQECWEKSCRLLGDTYRPKLISVRGDDEAGWRAAQEWKRAGHVSAVGMVISVPTFDETVNVLAGEINQADWCTFSYGCTVMRHLPEVLALLAQFAQRQVPIVVGGVFDGGFLVGGKLDGRTLRFDDPGDRSFLAWRKSFVALCDAHGITPAHACIQFALAVPGVAAVRIESTYADRVASNIRSAFTKVPAQFWLSMKEEGLLESECPFLD